MKLFHPSTASSTIEMGSKQTRPTPAQEEETNRLVENMLNECRKCCLTDACEEEFLETKRVVENVLNECKQRLTNTCKDRMTLEESQNMLKKLEETKQMSKNMLMKLQVANLETENDLARRTLVTSVEIDLGRLRIIQGAIRMQVCYLS